MNQSPPPGSRRPTIRDIADIVGVSIATVSRVLNDRPGVSNETRVLVRKVMEREGFTRLRRAPRTARVRDLIAVRCTYALEEYFGAVVSGIARSLRARGKRLVLSTDTSDNGAPNLDHLLLTDITDGALLVLPPDDPTAFLDLRDSGYPFVLVDPRFTPPEDVAAVSVAHAAGARAATQHLVDLGHRRIAIITGPPEQLSSDGRLSGYRAALSAAGVAAPDEYIRSAWEPDVNHGVSVSKALLDLAEPPTAIVGFNDKVAIGAMRAAAQRGMAVPAQLSVVGFDALELSRLVHPPLTTVRQPVDEMARIGVELLMRLINGLEVEALHVELMCDLVLRSSTAPPPR